MSLLFDNRQPSIDKGVAFYGYFSNTFIVILVSFNAMIIVSSIWGETFV